MRRWSVILVSPKEPGNVGGIARVMRNFGLSTLRIVEPRCEFAGSDARRFSAGAADVLRNATVFSTLREAIADMQLSVALTGASGRHHRLDCNRLVPEEMLRGKEEYKRCALVFGREERGMESEELEVCDFRWSLPTNPDFPSLNLAQAAGVALSGVAEAERLLGLSEVGLGIAPSGKSLGPLTGMANGVDDQPPANEEVRLLEDHFRRLMLRTGWDDGRRLVGSLAKIRNVLLRANATRREVNLFHGICRQAIAALDHPERFASNPDAEKDDRTDV
ncbi:hypothetical protein GC173_00520 [bacterium]|nr:hypothetical protein [bacterium]